MCPNCVTPWKCNGPHIPEPETGCENSPNGEHLCAYCDQYIRARPDTAALDEGFIRCPLCGDAEHTEDVVAGVCLTCADAITFAQHNRRSRIIVLETSND